MTDSWISARLKMRPKFSSLQCFVALFSVIKVLFRSQIILTCFFCWYAFHDKLRSISSKALASSSILVQHIIWPISILMLHGCTSVLKTSKWTRTSETVTGTQCKNFFYIQIKVRIFMRRHAAYELVTKHKFESSSLIFPTCDSFFNKSFWWSVYIQSFFTWLTASKDQICWSYVP